MSQIIDKRHNNRHKSAVNRRRFLERFKKQIRKSVADAVVNRSITDFEHGEKITIPTKDTTEPTFKHGIGKTGTIVLPGNKDFSRGDKIPRPQANDADSGSTQASNSDETTEDNFGFEISREEFLEIFFDDLELPHLLKKQLGLSKIVKQVRAGFTTDGVPTNLNIVRTMRNALARRIAMSAPKKRELKQAEQELEALLNTNNKSSSLVKQQQEKIATLTEKIKRIPFVDPFDLKYNRRVSQPMPASKAVVFCIMDVSGSMDEAKKDLAKRFFILLYLFLTKTYETIEIVFIRHHTSAKEVSEQDFFYSRETGGTVVSSALELMGDIIHDRYPTNEWNIYGAQASDGDNWNNDSPHCKEILMSKIMPYVQYFAYVEIMPRHHQSLWDEYTQVNAAFPNFAMQHITHMKEIYPIFRELFKRQQVS
jgi:uncharacterized sporulation protein YeaH/YhbH (DUF444 family)